MKYYLVIGLVILALLAVDGMYVVGAGHAAVLTRLGHVEASAVAPGLHFKLPFIDDANVYDTRAITVQAEPEDCKTAGGEAVRVGYFVRWRVADPDAYFKATGGDELRVAQRMAPAIGAALRTQVGAHSLGELITSDGGAIDQALRAAVGATLRAQLGIDVIDVGVERVLPPDAALAAIYKRMGADAAARAGSVRAEGAAAAAAIRAKGDAASQQQIAAADLAAASVRGEGDAVAAKIFASASAQNPDFFRYWSALETWRKTFAGGGAVIVLDKGSPFVEAIDAGAADGGAAKKR